MGEVGGRIFCFLSWINTLENGGGSQELWRNLTASSASEKIEKLPNHESLALAEREKLKLYLELYAVLHG